MLLLLQLHRRSFLFYDYYTGGGRMEKKRNWVVVEEEDEASFFFNSYLNPRTFCVAGRTPTRSGADVTPSPAAAATAAGAAHLKRRCQTL